MSGVNRREFFTKSVLGLMDDLATALGRAKKALNQPGDSGGWICLGRLPEFSLGITRVSPGTSITISVMSDGISARDENGHFKPLEIRSGTLWVNLNENWPEGSLVSIMTGERIDRTDGGTTT
ncbi:MAG: hypothetical protein AABZ55_02810 [Bdellovibrionota bacterium]